MSKPLTPEHRARWREAIKVVALLDENEALAKRVEELEAELDAAQLRSIEARNPGIDMDEVRRMRAANALHIDHLDDEDEHAEDRLIIPGSLDSEGSDKP